MIKSFFQVGLISLSAVTLTPKAEEGPGDLLASPNLPFNLVRFDETSGRIFATVDSSLMENNDSLMAMVMRISFYRIKDRWPKTTLRLALFPDKKYALYRNEVPASLVRDWQNNYLAEYDAINRKLTIFPALPAKRKTLNLDLCPDAKLASEKFYRNHCQNEESRNSTSRPARRLRRPLRKSPGAGPPPPPAAGPTG